MDGLAHITIIMTTWLPSGEAGRQRVEANCQAIDSWKKYLKLDIGSIRLHIADDGSEKPGYPWENIGDMLRAWWWDGPASFTRGPVTFSRQERRGVGASLNAGIKQLETSIFAYFVDDWMLKGTLDLGPWVAQLRVEGYTPDIGMIRLGPPHPWLTGTVSLFPHGWGMTLDRHHFAFGFRPALFHKRFIDTYGPFSEGTSSLECERLYNDHFCKTPGPEIVYALPYPWHHVGAEGGDELSAIVPEG